MTTIVCAIATPSEASSSAVTMIEARASPAAGVAVVGWDMRTGSPCGWCPGRFLTARTRNMTAAVQAARINIGGVQTLVRGT
ncbi:hypothetical protein GCM10009850_114280 [Nonomuraea monospora]|uniref:Uncharacterized protein n=1 Tax=Nonomuraea monospora TaxID=568818 RepID=A0ABN3D2Y9_9ACTN